MIGAHDGSLISRLRNWGRVARIDPCRPKGATINHLYQLITHDETDGYGEITEATIIVHQVELKPEPPELDHDDAENMGGWIAQLLQGYRATLAQRYVLGHPLERVGRDRHDAAVCALEQLMEANWETVRRMKRLGAV